MNCWVGGLLGCGVGITTWLVAGHFVARQRGELAPIRVLARGGLLRGGPGIASPQAVLTTAGLAAFGAHAARRAGSVGELISSLGVTGLLVAISLVDLQVRRIPNTLTVTLALWAAAQMLWLRRPTPAEAGLGLVVGGGLFVLLALARRGAMGAGDVKLAGAMGALVGYPLVLKALLWGILAGGVGALWFLISRRGVRRNYMPYGPYLALGGWAVWMGALGLWR